MTTVSTDELHARHGLPNNTIHRLIRKGIITPQGRAPGGGRGGSGPGEGYRFDAAEQRAVAAVIAFTRSHLVLERGSYWRAGMDTALRAIAESARSHDPADVSVRWIMLLGDGTCLRVSDELAASWPEPRTLIPLFEADAA